MIINYNSMASNALRQLNINSTQQAKSMAKLSSGLRINSAADDAAGLAISEKMKGQIRGLDQAARNAQDGQSLIQTAEGALGETTDILQRMRELAVQASNDTNTTDDRNAIQKEMDQLTSEIDRIGNTTEFNTKSLLNGGAGIEGNVTGTSKAAILGGSENVKTGTLNIDDLTASQKGTLSYQVQDASNVAQALTTSIGSFSLNGVSINIASGDTINDLVSKVNNASGQTNVTAAYDSSSKTLSFTTTGTGTASRIEMSGLDNVINQGSNTLKSDAATTGSYVAATGNETKTGTDASVTITSASAGTTVASGYTASGNIITFTGGDYDGLQIKVDSSANSVDGVGLNVTANHTLSLQIGANQDQTMSISINDMRAHALGVDNLDVTTTTGAESAITSIDTAIKQVSSERAKLGAYENRLDHTINNLNTSSQNTSDAQSRIADVDMAKEMMNQSKASVLAQAAQAMLAQANQQPQQVLQLLRG